MECPVCQKSMHEEDFGGVCVDVCKVGCKGIWFDWTELAKLDETHEGAGRALRDALMSDHHKDDSPGRINCPKCQKLMAAHLYQSNKQVTVDECYLCGGFFLDAGELEVIRENFMTEEDRDVYVQSILAGNSDIAQTENSEVSSAALDRAKAITKLAGLFQTIT
jgi:Zn-finger nucleic acid-binding protein